MIAALILSSLVTLGALAVALWLMREMGVTRLATARVVADSQAMVKKAEVEARWQFNRSEDLVTKLADAERRARRRSRRVAGTTDSRETNHD